MVLIYDPLGLKDPGVSVGLLALRVGSPQISSSSLAKTSFQDQMGPGSLEMTEHLLTCHGFCSLRICRVFFMETLFTFKSLSDSSIA